MKKSFKKSILLLWFALLGFIMPMQVSAYYIAGWGTNWNPDAYNMGSEGTYTFSMQTAGEYRFKVTAGNWDSQWGCGSLNASDVKGVATKGQCNNSGDDVVINLSKNADVTITFNGSKITVNAVENTTAVTCFLKGSFDSWGDGKEMTLNGNEYQIKDVSLTVGQEVKIYYASKTAGYDEVENKDSYISKDNTYGNIVIEQTGTYSFYYKISSNLIWLVQESTSSEEDYVHVCDPQNTKVIFKETFGTLPGLDARTDYSVTGETVEVSPGMIITYSASIPSYTASKTECGAMADAGRYTVLANPRNAGCGTNVAQSTANCNCYNSSERWYRDTEDHTDEANNGYVLFEDPNNKNKITSGADFITYDGSGDEIYGTNASMYGGMLLYNCANGTGSNLDVLYQCTISGLCENTYINFSAFVTCANTGRSGNIDIQAEFKLYSGTTATGTPISTIPVKNIGLNTSWKEISAMFNSASSSSVTIQLINKAAEGQGNDLLLDDITLSVCNPQAQLVFSGTTSSTATIAQGESKKLEASITSGLMTQSWYIWQSSTDNKTWTNISTAPTQVNVNLPATLDVAPLEKTYYRAIVASSEADADAILEGHNPSACGMYAITNIATLTVTISDLQLTSEISDGDICVDGVDNNVLTLKLKNPRLVNATGVKVTLENIEGLEIVKRSGQGNYANGVWTVGTLQASGEVIIYLNLKSSTSVASSLPKVIKAFVSFVDSERYASYDSAPVESKATTTITLNPVPKAPTVVPYDECAKSGDVALSTLATGTNLKFYSDASLTTLATKFPASTAVKDAKYYVTQTNTYGCISPSATINVTVKENPTLNSVSLDKTAICATDANSKAILSYNISGGLAPYTLYIDRTEAGVTETVNPNNLSTTGTRELKPSSDATYEFTKVVDANSCESTSDKTLSIDVQAINVTANISDVNVCADKTKLFTVEANGDNLNYKWSESTNGGATFSQVGTNSNEYTTGTFSMGDQKQYKVEVYQNPEVCKAVEGLSKVTVQDCSGFEIDYSAVTSATVCKGNNITLKVTLTNNADEAANSVDVKITNISNQTLVSRNPSVGSYNHNTGIWSIPSLASDATATLTIEIKGNVVATDLVSKAYVVKSGSTSYTEATTKADDSQSITIKDITLAPTLISETYKDCPKVGMLNLSTQVSSDATSLKFYTTETGSNTATQANTNTIGTTTYWVSNTKVGECESPRTKLDIVVYPQPTATLSGSSTICKGESANLTVQLTGKENYIITLSNGDIKPNVSGSSTQMAVSPDLTTNYTLRSVTDGNGCVATLSGSAKVTVNDVPVIEFTENPLPEYCAGVEYTLPTPNVDNKGSNVTESAWYLADKKLSSNKIKFTTDDNAKSLIYKAKNTCGETTATFVASLNVADCAELTLTYSLDKSSYCEEDDAVLTATLYNGSALDLNNVVVTNSWAGKQTSVLSEVSKGTYNNNTWTIDKLTKGETVTLTISFKVVEAEEFKIYVSQANGETYTFDTSVAKSTTQLVVKHFSSNVTVNNYINCPIDANSFLITDLVTSDKNDLKVWTKNAATGLYEKVNEVPTINPNQTTPAATYYITNTERGKCESTTPSPVTVEVFPQPTAVLSGSATICKGESTDLTITLTGKEKFNITLSNGDTKQDVSGNSVNMTVSPDLNTTYILRSVTDGNGCYATLSGDAIVTVNDEAIISDITAPAAICAGEPLSLPTPVITENGSVVTGGKWYLGGVEYTEGESVPDSKNGMMLQYKAQSSCGGEIKSNEVAITVYSLPALKFESPTSTICIDGTLNASDKQQTSAKVLFTAGEPTYKFSYSIGNKNYDDIEVTGTSHIIAHDIDADANITISKVVDTHGCVTKYNDVIHKVETQKHATLSPITAPETVCEADILELTAPTVTNNGARVDGEKWVLDNSDFDPATPMDYDIHNNKDLFYQINSYCNDIKRVVPSNKVKVTVYDQPEETSAGDDQAECGVSEFYLDAEEASAGSGKWIVASDSSEEWLKDVKFEDDTDPKTKVYGIPEGKSVTLMWTVSNGTCTPMSDLVQITNNMIPVLSEEITSVNSLDKDSIGYKETIELTCFNDKLYLIPSIKDAEGNDYPTDKLDFSWSKQDGNSFEAIGEGKTEIVREEGTYKLQVKDKATGCTSGVSYITIEDKKITPVIKNITSYTMSETGEATDVESNIINCYNPVLIIKPSLDNTDNIKYEWSTGSINDSIHVIREGDYFLKVQNTVSGCYAEEVKYSITENKRTPIIEDIISVNSTDETAEGYLETQVINCRDKELYISSVIKDKVETQYSPEELKYDWTVSYDDGEIFEAYGEASTISTTSKAIFRLVVTDKVTGCPAVADTIIIKENIVKPVISYIESYETINPTGTGIKEEDVLTCKKPVIYLRPTIEESTDVSYKWSDDSTEDYLKVEEQGTYGLVVKDNTSFCSSDEVTFSVTENKRTPIIDDIISVNSTDETVEGYKETQIINCKDTELFISSVIKDNVETQYSPEELEYDWTVSYDNGEIFEEYGEAATITATEEAIFRLVVTDNLTGCPAEAKTIEITEVKTTPTIKSMTSVSTIDPEAEKVEETNVLTCEYPVLYLKPTIESENEVSYKWNDESTLDYLKVEEKGTYTLIVKDETTFCSSEVYSYDVSENKNAPVLDIQSVYELCPSDTLSAKTLSSLLPNVAGVTYKFYDESGEEIADVYEVSSESSVNSYYVIGTSANGCSSEKASFDVDFAKNVDFTLTASQTSMMIGGNETVVTITPDADSDIATSYIWTANDEEIDVDGLEFVDNLYIDTNFKVTASNRCDSDTKEAFIEVLWPTAFTPHNGNGKNDTFAKGMKLIVFNRFYTKIFEGEDGWDGTINGSMNESESIAVPGVYYYSVLLPNGEVRKGTIEIIKID